MSKPFCMNLWLVIPEKVRYNRKKDISKPVISGEFRCVSAEKKAGHTPGGNLWMTGFDCTKKKWGFLRMSAESKTRMTEGSISKKMILFAIPLFLGNLFQQLYNTADSLIVGNFLGSNALAAVSSSGNLIFLMVGFINGIAMGAGVVIARYYGAKTGKICRSDPYDRGVRPGGRCSADCAWHVSGAEILVLMEHRPMSCRSPSNISVPILQDLLVLSCITFSSASCSPSATAVTR